MVAFEMRAEKSVTDIKKTLADMNSLIDSLDESSDAESHDFRIEFRHMYGGFGKQDGEKVFNKVRLYIYPLKDSILGQISKVVYILDQTFEPNEIIVENSEENVLNGFELQMESWKDFNAVAVVTFVDGEEVRLARHVKVTPARAGASPS